MTAAGDRRLLDGFRAAGLPVAFTTVAYDEAGKQAAEVFIAKIPALLVLEALTDPRTGAPVASPTTSLPEAPGGTRQFDYRYTWLRDSGHAVAAAALLAPFFASAQLLSRAVPEAMGAQGSFVAINNVVSQSVPHLHAHVVPRVRRDGLRGFFWPRRKYEGDEHAAEAAAKIRDAVARLG